MLEPRSGVAAEFATLAALLAGLERLRTHGVTQLEAYTPFPCPEVDLVLKRPRSRLPFWIAGAGALGAGGAYFLQWLVTAYLYPVHVGGRPPHFILAYVPITFEMGVLAASVAGFVGALFAGRLLRLWSPLSEIDALRSASNHHFWLAADDGDPRYEEDFIRDALQSADALQVVTFGDKTADGRGPHGEAA